MLEIREAITKDANRISAFWNPIIRNTTVTFSTDERSTAQIEEMIVAQPFYVAVIDNLVQGFATYKQFRAGNGYRKVMEHTIILAPDIRGVGAGRALMSAIENDAKSKGYHALVAGVTAENAAAIAFHSKLGFTETGRMPDMGYKFGRYLELVLMQKIL